MVDFKGEKAFSAIYPLLVMQIDYQLPRLPSIVRLDHIVLRA
jgi:hypothetical protein